MTIQVSKPENNRLLRDFPDVTALAEELYAMLPELITDVQANNPTVLNSGPDLPAPLQQTDTGTGDIPFLRINRGTDPPININFSPEGDLILPQGPVSSVGTSAWSGQIVSGSGDTYVVNTYRSGLSQVPTPLTVRQLQIDSADAIPAGSWVKVFKEPDGTFTMQVPVFV
jgi:hypothetical protein